MHRHDAVKALLNGLKIYVPTNKHQSYKYLLLNENQKIVNDRGGRWPVSAQNLVDIAYFRSYARENDWEIYIEEFEPRFIYFRLEE